MKTDRISQTDERTPRDPAEREKSRKQHLANAAEWLRRARAFDRKAAPDGADYETIVAVYREECKFANVSAAL